MSNMKNMMHYITAEAAEQHWPGWVLGEAAGNLRAEVVTVDGVVLLPLLDRPLSRHAHVVAARPAPAPANLALEVVQSQSYLVSRPFAQRAVTLKIRSFYFFSHHKIAYLDLCI